MKRTQIALRLFALCAAGAGLALLWQWQAGRTRACAPSVAHEGSKEPLSGRTQGTPTPALEPHLPGSTLATAQHEKEALPHLVIPRSAEQGDGEISGLIPVRR